MSDTHTFFFVMASLMTEQDLAGQGLTSNCSNCGHVGHLDCLEKWYETENNCPTGCGCR